MTTIRKLEIKKAPTLEIVEFKRPPTLEIIGFEGSATSTNRINDSFNEKNIVYLPIVSKIREESDDEDDEDDEDEEKGEDKPGRPYFCYLLRSITCTKTYVGYSVNVYKRLRKHNRELAGGARATLKNGPWEIVFYVTGFKDSRSALQFEWKCNENRRYKTVEGKIKYMAHVLALDKWTSTAPDINSLNLSIMWLKSGFRLPFCPPHYNEFYLPEPGSTPILLPSGPIPPIGSNVKKISKKRYKKYKKY